MRILFLSKFLTHGGSALHQYHLARALIEAGNEVCIASSGPIDNKDAIDKFEKSKKYKIEHFKLDFPHNNPDNLIVKIYLLFRYVILIPKFLIFVFKYKPDVIHVHYPVTSYLAKIYGILTQKRFVSTYHTVGIPKHILHYKADHVIAISQGLKYELSKKFGYKDKQIHLINNGVSSLKFDGKKLDNKNMLLDTLELPHDKPIIGFVGSLTHIKGIDLLCEALKDIHNDFYLVLVGQGNVEWVESLVENNNLKGKVSIYPFQDPYPFYQIFDFFVLPSRVEGFALVTVEAMMMNLPIIRSNTQDASEQLEYGVNGFIFENENVDELREYCNTLLLNKDLRVKMGEESRQIALARFTEDMMTQKTINLYQLLLKE